MYKFMCEKDELHKIGYEKVKKTEDKRRESDQHHPYSFIMWTNRSNWPICRDFECPIFVTVFREHYWRLWVVTPTDMTPGNGPIT